MVGLQLELPDSFLQEEIRCGHLITKKMKEVWAIELDLLMELQRVCTKYDLKLCAESGTLLGAVRHQGFIPWDDDIDVAMPREDYIRLCEIAKEEFASPYFFDYYGSDVTFDNGFAKLMNLNTTFLQNNTLAYQGIFIDIFPLDNIPDDEGERIMQGQYIYKYWRKVGRISYCSLPYSSMDKGNGLRKVARFGLYWLYKALRMNRGSSYYARLFSKYEEGCKQYNNKETKYMGTLSTHLNKIPGLYLRSDMENLQLANFEFVSIPIAPHYDEVLKGLYGDWHKQVKGTSVHSCLSVDTDNPYLGNRMK